MSSPLSSRGLLYVGQVSPGGTCRDRMLALEDLGWEVTPFDTTPYLRSGPRLLRSLAHRLNMGLRIRRLNSDLTKLVETGGSSSVVWIDKGKWIYPETVDTLRKRFGGPLVHFTPDPQLIHHKSRHFRRSIPRYDVLVTTKLFEVDDYWDAGAQRLMLTGQAYDERRAANAQQRSELASGVCFIGHHEDYYSDMLSHIAQEDVPLKVWGPNWRASRFDFVRGDGLWEGDYYDGLKSAKIGLGLLSKLIPEVSTTRSFEIPATGTLLLAERTDEHQRYFEEGTEAEFFADPKEMLAKIRFYLRNEGARLRVGKAGRRKCESAGYGNRSRLQSVMKAIAGGKAFADLRFHQ